MSSNETSNIKDYIQWIGTIPFPGTVFCEVDAVLLCQISYTHFTGLFDSLDDTKSLEDMSRIINSSKENYVKYMDIGTMNAEIPHIFLDTAACQRYKNVKLTRFVSKFELGKTVAQQEQFAAMAYIFDEKKLCVVFRGTDDSVVGWREDCNLALTDEVPAQKDALEYLRSILSAFPDYEIYVAGHSKGGNLAMYAAAKLTADEKKRLTVVYNLDGPGFTKKTLESKPFQELRPLLKSYYPHQAIVGMLFEHYPEYTVVKSSAKLVMQHELCSWQVMGNKLITENALHPGSVYMNTAVNKFLEKCGHDLREGFIDAVFSILDGTNSVTIAEMIGNSQTDMIQAKMNFEKAKNSEEDRPEALKAAAKSLGDAISGTFKNVTRSIGKATVAAAKLMKDEKTRNVLIQVAENFKEAGGTEILHTLNKNS